MSKRSLALLLMCLGALFAMPVTASADTQDILQPQHDPPSAADGWQAGTCNEIECTPESPHEAYYTQAGGHPPFAITQYTVKQEKVEVAPGDIREIPVGTLGELRVDLPPGLTVNPQATPTRCKMSEFDTPTGPAEAPACPPTTVVGVEKVWLKVVLGPGAGTPVAPIPGVTEVPLYNLEPEFGEPAKFGFKIGAPGKKSSVFLRADVAWENDFHAGFTIDLPQPDPTSPTRTWKSRLINLGALAGDGTYINLPTTCFNPHVPNPETENIYSTWARASTAVEEETGQDASFPVGYTPFEAELPPGVQPTGCENVPFEPTLEINPGTSHVDSPAPATVTARMPFDPAKEGGPGKLVQSHVRKAEVSLPKGMGLNPSGAQGLLACTDAQFKKGVRVYNNECPAASVIGRVVVDSPPLAEPLVGNVYVGEQKSMNPESGDLYRILLEAKNEKEGIAARLVGRVKADKTTGQLTAEIYDDIKGQFTDQPAGLPQVPFEEIRIHFGPRNVLSSPPICSTESTSLFEPWARPGEQKPAKSTVTVTNDPAGGPCPKTMAERRFHPGYAAAPDSDRAGIYSTFRLNIGRGDGQQELKVVDVTLPKGLTGKLAGIPYCSEAAIDAARGNAGKAELANPSCSNESRIGSVKTRSGTGANPLLLGGDAYLAGPYKGADLSMVTITPAVAGPFDLGTVVVRVALHVDPETAQIRALSDVIPDVFGGAKLDLRGIDIDVDRKRFMLNPTNCKPQQITGTINGGGADPTNAAAFSAYAVDDPFRATQCRKLGFKPKLRVKLFGGTVRDKNPRLKAVLTARNGDANVARTALTMPRSLFLDQSHIGTVCTRPQLAAHKCPKASVYGNGWAKSPLLAKPLKGKVYLVSSDNELPDLLVDLRGQVDIHLRGVISSKRGGLKTVFRNVPDVPVSKFVLNMKGGEKSLLVNSQNTCARPQRAVLNIKGHNSRKIKNNRYKLNVVSCNKKGQ